MKLPVIKWSEVSNWVVKSLPQLLHKAKTYDVMSKVLYVSEPLAQLSTSGIKKNNSKPTATLSFLHQGRNITTCMHLSMMHMLLKYKICSYKCLSLLFVTVTSIITKSSFGRKAFVWLRFLYHSPLFRYDKTGTWRW